jgi:hypothetical protein
VTPEDVVARARTLEDQEVLLTVRGTVRHFAGDQWGVYRGMPFTVMLNNPDGVHSDLVSIEPAPMSIKYGQLYADTNGGLYRGNHGPTVSPINDVDHFYNPTDLPGLRAVKVVDA